MKPYYERGGVVLYHGDCFDVLPSLPAGSVDAVITDPPYGLEFMGKEGDRFGGGSPHGWKTGSGGFSQPGIGKRPTSWTSFGVGQSGEFGGANPTCGKCGGRARGAKKCGCEEPDWRVKGQPVDRDLRKNNVGASVAYGDFSFAWASAVLRVLKPGGYMLCFGGVRTYHRLACAVEDAGFEIRDCLMWLYNSGFPKARSCLKPAYEPILLCRKPAVAVAPLGIDECRIETRDGKNKVGPSRRSNVIRVGGEGTSPNESTSGGPGRWPANVVHDGGDAVLEAFAASGSRSLSRFFFCTKAGREERGLGNNHPTVKPLKLMRWLVRLVGKVDEIVLDPFVGSGTTGLAAATQGRRFIGIERNADYVGITKRRLVDVLMRESNPTGFGLV